MKGWQRVPMYEYCMCKLYSQYIQIFLKKWLLIRTAEKNIDFNIEHVQN